MVDGCTATDRTKSDSVDFLVCFERITGKFHADVLIDTGIVTVVINTESCTRTTFYLFGSLIVLGFTADYQATPVTGLAVTRSLFGSHYDRSFFGSFHFYVTAGFYYKGGFGLLVAFNDCTCGNSQLGSAGNVYPTFQEVSSFFQCYVTGKYKFLVATTQFCTFVE